MSEPAPVELAFELEGRQMTCRVLRARRRTYALRVSADGGLELRVPQRLAAHRWPGLLVRHRRWIVGQLERLAQTPPPPLATFGLGSRQRFLGQAHPLRLTQGRTQVALTDVGFSVRVRSPETPSLVARALDGWYRSQAQALLPPRLSVLAETLPWLRRPTVKAPRVVRLRSRWGSCASDGRITLNLGLVLLAPDLIDYVLLHELCHLREMNHGPRFYALLAAVVPDFRERQAVLRAERPWHPTLI